MMPGNSTNNEIEELPRDNIHVREEVVQIETEEFPVDDAPVHQQRVEQVQLQHRNDRDIQLYLFFMTYIFLPLYTIYTALEGLFFYIRNQRKALLIICLALIVLVPSITIYFTVFHHHPYTSPIKARVSNASIYQFDTLGDYLSYNTTFFLDISNSYKTNQLNMKSNVTVLSYKRVIGFQDIPPLFLNTSSHQNISFSLHRGKIYFKPKTYVSNSKLILNLLIISDITTHSTLPPYKVSTYPLQVGCDIIATRGLNGYVLARERCRMLEKL